MRRSATVSVHTVAVTHWVVVAVFAAAFCGETTVTAVQPEARASAAVVVSTHKDTDVVVPLQARVPIPDADELNWPINVRDRSVTVEDVSVTLHGLWHEQASDLKISLRHASKAAVLGQMEGGARTFGEPELPRFPHASVRDRQLDADQPTDVEGVGSTYTFRDANSTNLAQGQPTNQSTTEFGGVSSRAVDGDVRGFFSLDTVTHTGGHGTNDPQPWWEVDVGSQFPSGSATIGTIRLWNRELQPSLDEVQLVQLRAPGAIPEGDTFRLSFTWDGVSATSPPISVRAVAERRDEAPFGTPASPGAGHNESMQAALEAMPNILSASVTRAGPFSNNGYDWVVTLRSPPGNLPNLVPDATGIDSNVVPQLHVFTRRNGTDNVYYNYKNELTAITGRLYPCWVMVSTSRIGAADLDTAKSMSVFRRRVTDSERREHTIVLPRTMQGSFVRVQLEDDDFLSIAEVEVFQSRFESLATFSGGSPIPSGTTFHPTFSMQETFAGEAVQGMWLLSIQDTVAREETSALTSRPTQLAHGVGALHTWSLTLYCSDGSERTYTADVMFRIDTMPLYGTLYAYNSSASTRGAAVPTVPSQERHLSACYGDCSSRFGVGVPLSTNKLGSVAASTNRVTQDNMYAVVYAPNDKWLGTDTFTYSAMLGGGVSPSVSATVRVLECRGHVGCLNEVASDFVIIKQV